MTASDACKFASCVLEVQILSPLLASERFELACNAIGREQTPKAAARAEVTFAGLVEFQPGERVLHQGLMRTAKLWSFCSTGVTRSSHFISAGLLVPSDVLRYVIHSGTGVAP